MTLKYNNVFIEDAYTICGNYENDGPLSKYFDKKYEKDLYFGEKSWEQAEVHLLKEANTNILKKNKVHITENCFYTDVEFVLKCCHRCENLILFNVPIYYYRLARSGQSMSIQGVRKHYKDHLKMLYTMLNYEKKYTMDTPVQEIFKRRLLSACEFQYIFFFALECTKEKKEDFIQYDTFLKNNFPVYYKSIRNNAVKLLRKMHFIGYKIISKIQTIRDKKRKINIFEGC